jgi:hypothetical protein
LGKTRLGSKGVPPQDSFQREKLPYLL